MELPPYYLSRPTATCDPNTIANFERLFQDIVHRGNDRFIDYSLPYPKWQFLNYLCEQKDVVLHGSGNGEIVEFEPRKSNDVEEFGNRTAVYAAADGIWPMFFAIVDRDKHVTSLVNGCFRVIGTETTSGPFYYFSINGDALPHKPWRNGTIYLLSGEGFEQQPRQRSRGFEIEIPQRASLSPVKPLAKLSVTPEDFPFLAHVHPHDPITLQERARVNPDGFPWNDA